MSQLRKRFLWLLALLLVLSVAWSWTSGGIVRQLVSSDDAAASVEQVKQFITGFGAAAPLVYVVMVVIEVVVAPIPGLMLYAPGGIIFGPLWGGALSLLGNVIGAAIACGLTRSIGDSWLSRFFDRDRVEQIQQRIESRGAWWIFLLRLNPLTSSDIVSYAAGFSRIPLWKIVLATGCGMAPLCFAQAWLAESLLTSYPELMYPLAVLLVLYLVAVIVVVFRLVKGGSQQHKKST